MVTGTDGPRPGPGYTDIRDPHRATVGVTLAPQARPPTRLSAQATAVISLAVTVTVVFHAPARERQREARMRVIWGNTNLCYEKKFLIIISLNGLHLAQAAR
jgi:hypothetical protein